VRENDKSEEERGRAVDHLRDFLNVNYVPATEVARSLNVRPERVYSWLSGKSRPSHPERITAFLDALPNEPGSGVTPTGYEYREYKNWRGIPKPRRCPFCKQAKGEVQKVRGGFQGVCPKCGASGPKQFERVAALLAWNGKAKDFIFGSDQSLNFRPPKRSVSKAPPPFKIRRKNGDREPRESTSASRKTRTVTR
jgi:rubredoxin